MSALKTYKIIQQSTGTVVATQCVHANTVHSRLVGLLNHKALASGEALLLDPCNQVHTFFMRFAIDAVFLTKDNRVLGVSELQPWRLSALYWRARKVLELPLGTCATHHIKSGDILEVQSC